MTNGERASSTRTNLAEPTETSVDH